MGGVGGAGQLGGELPRRVKRVAVPHRGEGDDGGLLLFNYNDAFDTPGELCAKLACAGYTACAAGSEIGGDIDAMDLPVCFGIP